MESDPDFENVYNNLSEEDRNELEEIRKDLIKLDDEKNPDKPLKQRLAKLFLKLIYQTPLNNTSIEETSYIIANFIQYDFNDELDDIISDFGELELPKDHVSGDVFLKWIEDKKKIENYLKKALI